MALDRFTRTARALELAVKIVAANKPTKGETTMSDNLFGNLSREEIEGKHDSKPRPGSRQPRARDTDPKNNKLSRQPQTRPDRRSKASGHRQDNSSL